MSGGKSHSGSEEWEIINRIVRGEVHEFRELVTRHEHAVFSLIARQVGDREIARDLTQDVFIKAFAGLPQFQRRARFSTWITRIALNVVNSYFVSRQGKDRRRWVAIEKTSEASAGDGGAREKEERVGLLREAIQRLGEKHRDVVMLCFMDERTYREAAEILDVPEGTVASRLSAALRQLKGLMEEAL